MIVFILCEAALLAMIIRKREVRLLGKNILIYGLVAGCGIYLIKASVDAKCIVFIKSFKISTNQILDLLGYDKFGIKYELCSMSHTPSEIRG